MKEPVKDTVVVELLVVVIVTTSVTITRIVAMIKLNTVRRNLDQVPVPGQVSFLGRNLDQIPVQILISHIFFR